MNNNLYSTQILNLFSSNLDLTFCLTNCSNSGQCLVSNSTVKCVCNQNFFGKACQYNIYECPTNMCLNNGTCFGSLNNNKTSAFNSTYYCKCTANYYGNYCENKVDICQNVTCSYNGECYEYSNSTKCKCHFMYQGNDCELESVEFKTIKVVISVTSIIAIVVVICFYLIIISMDIFDYLIKGKKSLNRNRKIKPIKIRFQYIN